jgi:multicomponent Na+:H+ antiporter subunit E
MKMFLLNVLLAVVWMFMWGAFDPWTFVAGLLLAYVMLSLLSRTIPGETYGGRLGRLIRFVVYFIRILVKANWDVAKVVLKPGFHEKSSIIRYPVGDLTDVQLTVLANAITLTPGTLSMDVSEDRQWLYVHCMIGHDREALMNDIGDLRRRILEEFL